VREWFETACGHAILAGVAGREGSGPGVSSDEASIEADRAMALLTNFVGMGYRNVYRAPMSAKREV
jgi:hypothetical protein